MKTLLINLLLFLTQSIAFADQDAALLLEKDLEKSFLMLGHEIRMYHYFNLSDSSALGNQSSRQSLSSGLINYRSSQFWNLDNHNLKLSNVGPGLYLSLDPFSSSPFAAFYSGANFGDLMLELTFSHDTKYFNILKPIQLGPETINALISENLLTPNQVKNLLQGQKFSQDTLKYIVEPQYSTFRALVHDIFRKNNITLIEYIWMSALQMLCNNKYIGSSMLYIGETSNTSSLKESTLVTWSSKIVDLTSAETESEKRNNKLRNVLMSLKALERSYDNNSGQWKRGRIMKEVQEIISSNYGNNPGELQGIKKNSFKCEDSSN